ncbi:hypothetical protein A8709_31980 [Paenibacillus pectinilyticus]|uniref:Uncharacterized protein n=1 Tax=Paenibacillus pectinilyticus TaxID=512399 RepID=A0A1C0ZWJ3_9BACL|nr:hypothetical protein [Paenibacillus pectinilyticus]OCT12447.1 hypothetical protein A8709_31980 [Paenibacillus pectinilyticus]
MIMDYCEQEITEEKTLLHIGLQFEDEPDSLYVAELEIDEDGVVASWQLFFNGFDCKYNFRPSEKAEMMHYAAQQGITIREGDE